jgi:hypothetical protein
LLAGKGILVAIVLWIIATGVLISRKVKYAQTEKRWHEKYHYEYTGYTDCNGRTVTYGIVRVNNKKG